jgi:hypothetical protein
LEISISGFIGAGNYGGKILYSEAPFGMNAIFMKNCVHYKCHPSYEEIKIYLYKRGF